MTNAESDPHSIPIPRASAPHTEGHTPVLPAQVLSLLAPRAGDVVLDATAGLGGHAGSLARAIGPAGVLVLNDLDAGNLPRAEAHVRSACVRGDEPAGARAIQPADGPPRDGATRETPQDTARTGPPEIVTLHGNFADAPSALLGRGLRADIVLADLGFASHQMDDAERGFAFGRDGPLDMRLDPSGPITAAELVNTLPEAELTDLIRGFGEEPQARRVARAIVEARAATPIETTGALAQLLIDTLGRASGARNPGPRAVRGGSGRSGAGRSGAGRKPIHPATRTFQALRIAVNGELASLDALLSSVLSAAGAHTDQRGSASWLAPAARVGVISFHSLEDRAVKRAFRELTTTGRAHKVGDAPTVATDDEIARNPRARSAKLRVIRLA